MGFNTGRRSRPATRIIGRLSSIVGIIVGFIMCCPFWFHMFFGKHEPYISLWTIFGVILVVIGTPIMFMGLTTLRGSGKPSSSTESDISRIRFAAETQMYKDTFKK